MFVGNLWIIQKLLCAFIYMKRRRRRRRYGYYYKICYECVAHINLGHVLNLITCIIIQKRVWCWFVNILLCTSLRNKKTIEGTVRRDDDGRFVRLSYRVYGWCKNKNERTVVLHFFFHLILLCRNSWCFFFFWVSESFWERKKPSPYILKITFYWICYNGKIC